MSDEDKEFIDVESDEETNPSEQYSNPADKRAHHNALERKRRDHIKESFVSLRDAIPGNPGEKQASRAQILKNATDYITNMKGKSGKHKAAIDDLRTENKELEEQIMALEQLVDSNDYSASHTVENFIEETTTVEEVPEQEYKPPRKKKAKN